jgi:NRPS condensation-like uncharacterized protein
MMPQPLPLPVLRVRFRSFMNKQEPSTTSTNRQAAPRNSDRMSAAVRAHLENRLRSAAATLAHCESDQIEPVPRTEQIPVSIIQEIVFNYLKTKAGARYSPISRCLRISGDLNLAILKKSINELVRRHETLRTRFSPLTRPLQIIDPFRPAAIPIISLEEFSEQERFDRASQILIDAQSYCYDPTTEPLWRVFLLRLTPRDHLLFITLDHIIADDWGMTILLRDLRIVFGAFMLGKTSPLPDLPIQYADFAFWQRKTLQGKRLEELSSFWRRHLQDTPVWPELRLPFERIGDSESGLVAKSIEEIYISESLFTALKNFASTNRVTLFMVLLTALISLLHRYTQKKIISITSTIANRHRPETNDIVGWLSDLLVFRFLHADLENFSDLLKHVRDVVLEAYQHQDLPMARFPGYEADWWTRVVYPSVRFHMRIDESSNSNSGLETVPRQDLPDLVITPMPVPAPEGEHSIKPGLLLSVDQRGNGLEVSITYEKARYSSTDIIQFAQDFRSIIEAGVCYQS